MTLLLQKFLIPFNSQAQISSTAGMVCAELCRTYGVCDLGFIVHSVHTCTKFVWTRSLSAGEVGASVSRHSYIFLQAKISWGCNIDHSSHSLRHLHPTNSTPMHPNYVLFLSYGIADSRLDPVRIHSESLFPSPFTMHIHEMKAEI